MKGAILLKNKYKKYGDERYSISRCKNFHYQTIPIKQVQNLHIFALRAPHTSTELHVVRATLQSQLNAFLDDEMVT